MINDNISVATTNVIIITLMVFIIFTVATYLPPIERIDYSESKCVKKCMQKYNGMYVNINGGLLCSLVLYDIP